MMKSHLWDTVLVHTGRSLIEPGFHWTYHEKNGAPVLKTERSWRKISGFCYATDDRCHRHPSARVVFIQFRRRFRP